MKLRLVLPIVFSILHSSNGARILGVFAHHVRSNSLHCNSVMSALADKGHNVTVYSPFDIGISNNNMTHVKVQTDYFKSLIGIFDYHYFLKGIARKSGFGGGLLRSITYDKCDSFFEHPSIKSLLYSKESFDLVVTEGTFGEESMLVFGHIFNAPTVVIMPAGTWSTVNLMAGNALSIAHIPDYIAFPYSNRMTFTERLWNFLSAVTRIVYYYWEELPTHDAIIKRHVKGLEVPPVEDMVRNVSLTLVNTHPVIGYPQPYSPNIVQIGGIHFRNKMDALPQDLKTFVDNAVEGFIYFSLGSIVPPESMPLELVELYNNVFKRFPYKILWKMSPNRTKFSDNIMTHDWVPQQSVLAHPNCILFITHGGIGGQLEAFYAGVPVIGIPYFADQPYNIRLYEELGVGVGLDLQSISEHTVSMAINKVLDNKSYRENAKRVSGLFKDLPRSAADTAVYWMEYVIRHRGGPHLRPHAANLSWYQLILFDVIAVTLAILLFIIFILVLLFRKFNIYIFIPIITLSIHTYKKNKRI